jgi:hypothetical protein
MRIVITLRLTGQKPRKEEILEFDVQSHSPLQVAEDCWQEVYYKAGDLCADRVFVTPEYQSGGLEKVSVTERKRNPWLGAASSWERDPI